MTTAIDTYLGWDQPEHFDGCKRPTWSVTFRRDERELRGRGGMEAHDCANEACQHGDWYARTTVRVVCTSCQAALVVRGEDAGMSSGSAKNTTHGYGLPPRRVAGLLLWPGEPYLNFGRLRSDEPYDLVVTRPGVKTVSEADIVGLIGQSIGKRHATTWTAAALPSPDGPYGVGQHIRWSKVSTDGKPLRSVGAAARWVAARLAEAEAGEAA